MDKQIDSASLDVLMVRLGCHLEIENVLVFVLKVGGVNLIQMSVLILLFVFLFLFRESFLNILL